MKLVSNQVKFSIHGLLLNSVEMPDKDMKEFSELQV